MEVFELATSIKLLSSAYEKTYKNSSVVIQFQEYDEHAHLDSEFVIGHFHIHIVPKDNTDPKADDIYAILQEDDKDFIINFKKKLKQASAITDQNLLGLQNDGKKIRDLVAAEMPSVQMED